MAIGKRLCTPEIIAQIQREIMAFFEKIIIRSFRLKGK